MTTKKDFIEWLKQFPDDTIIEVVNQSESKNYESYGSTSFVSIDIDENERGEYWEYLDFTDNKFVSKEAEHYKKRYLQLGFCR